MMFKKLFALFFITSLLGRLEAFPMFEENSFFENTRSNSSNIRSTTGGADLSRRVGAVECRATAEPSNESALSQPKKKPKRFRFTVNSNEDGERLSASGDFPSFQTLNVADANLALLIQEAKRINPALESVIDEWSHSEDSEVRAQIINTQILESANSEEEKLERQGIAQLLQKVEEYHHQIAAEEVDFITFARATQTMACLWRLSNSDASNKSLKPVTENFKWNDALLLLNNGVDPVRLVVPPNHKRPRGTSFIPKIIPAGVRSIDDITTICSTRLPGKFENQKVRRLIREAFRIHYGVSQQKFLLSLSESIWSCKRDRALNPLKDNFTPVTIRVIKQLFNRITDWNKSHYQNKIMRDSQIPFLLAIELSPALINSNNKEREQAQRLFKNALGSAPWDASGTMAYKIAFVVGAVVPISVLVVAHANLPFIIISGIAGGAVSVPIVTALVQARELFNRWSGANIHRAIKLIQQTQNRDSVAIISLNDFLGSGAPVEKSSSSDQAKYNPVALSSSAASSRRAVDIEQTETDEGASITVPKLTRKYLKRIGIKIEQNITFREDLINKLQAKSAQIKTQDNPAKAKANTPAGRLKWGRLP